ncbi:MAG: phage/plasmid primase, P4 family [Thainema sp.]
MDENTANDRNMNHCDRPDIDVDISCNHSTERTPKKLRSAHLKDLRASGLTDDQIKQTGHFYADPETAESLLGVSLGGLVFQYCDPEGKPYLRSDDQPFYRIKPDWDDPTDKPKYLSPKGQGCRPYFSKLYPNWETTIKSTKIDLWETEGEKKGDCGCARGLAVLAFGGVDSWVDSCDRSSGEKLEKSRVLPELDVINWRNRRVNQCFDSDIIEKIGVQTALAKRAYELTKLGASPYLVLLPNETDGDKNGLDDFIVRHGVEALKALAEAAKPTSFKAEIEGDGDDEAVSVVLNLKEPSIRYKALMAWSVLKEVWAYRPGLGWYQWQGTHWSLVAEDEFNAELMRFMDAQQWDNRSIGHIKSISSELKSRLLVKEKCWGSSEKIGFTNGTLNLKTEVFVAKHNPLDRLVQVRPYAFDREADCPTWLTFIREAMEEDIERVNLVQAMFRYALLPRPKNQKAEIEKSFDLHGKKGTGKGTTLDVLSKLAGEENIAGIKVDSFKSAQGLAMMVDKLIAIDYDAMGYLSNVGDFNRVVSNEPVVVKKLYKDTCSVRLGITIIRAYNEHVAVPDGSEGLDRRLTVIPFRHRPEKVDNDLSKKLEAELPGIFMWCYRLSHGVMRQRIMNAGKIQAIAQSNMERFEADNPEFRFLCEGFPNGAVSIKAGDLYKQYIAWCVENGIEKKKSNVKFSAAIKSLGCERSSGKLNGCYYYTIPKMSEFDVADHLGIVEGQSRDSFRDSSNPDTAIDRDSCRQLDSKTSINIEEDQDQSDKTPIQEELWLQVSPTVPKPYLARDSIVSQTVSQPSPTVSSVYHANIQVGDRGEVLHDDCWKLATFTTLPNDDPDPRKRLSMWQVEFEDGSKTWIPDACKIRPISNRQSQSD